MMVSLIQPSLRDVRTKKMPPRTKVRGYYRCVPPGRIGLYQIKNAIVFSGEAVVTYQQSPTSPSGTKLSPLLRMFVDPATVLALVCRVYLLLYLRLRSYAARHWDESARAFSRPEDAK
jgi:hypothetical protein